MSSDLPWSSEVPPRSISVAVKMIMTMSKYIPIVWFLRDIFTCWRISYLRVLKCLCRLIMDHTRTANVTYNWSLFLSFQMDRKYCTTHRSQEKSFVTWSFPEKMLIDILLCTMKTILYHPEPPLCCCSACVSSLGRNDKAPISVNSYIIPLTHK